jgi:hypothetical protein
MTDITVNDLRLEGDSSLSLVPRCHTLADLEQYFGIQVDRSLGWDAAPPSLR